MGGFSSSRELREILDTVLSEIDRDPEEGPRLRAAAAPLRLEFPDLKLVVNVRADDGGGHCLSWDFRKRVVLGSEAQAHHGVRGRQPAPAGAGEPGDRDRPRPPAARVADAGAALRFFPAAKPLFSRYRELVSEKYPHLAID